MTLEQAREIIHKSPYFPEMLKLCIRYDRSLYSSAEKDQAEARTRKKYAEEPEDILHAHTSIFNDKSQACIKLRMLATVLTLHCKELGVPIKSYDGKSQRPHFYLDTKQLENTQC